MLNEKALERAMKEAWKGSGYIVGCFDMEGDPMIVLTTPDWQMACDLPVYAPAVSGSDRRTLR